MTPPDRREFLRLLGGGALALSSLPLLSCGDGGGRPTRPNVIFILADEHRADALGCAGHPWIRTPGLDRLAAGGVRFTSAFVTTSLCSPSRASYLTGVYPHVHGVTENEHHDPTPSLPTFPELLHDAGYHTAFIGKWHMARWSTPRPGFDHWVSFNGQGNYLRNTLNVDGQWELSERHITDELTDRALAFLGRDRAPDQPFLLYLSHKAAHAPFEPLPRHADLYHDVPIAQLAAEPGALAAKPDWGGRDAERDQATFMRQYARTIAGLDDSTARLLDWLDANGQLARTVIVYASDNGYLRGEHGGLWDKRAAYDPSIRVPLLMHAPQVATPGTVSDQLVLNIDLLPTLLDLAGVAVPPGVQGRSWLPLLAGADGRDGFLYEYFAELGDVPTTVAVRTHTWKYIHFPANPELTDELYHLAHDPGEQHNLIDDPAHADQLATLRQALRRYQEQTGYPSPDASP